MMEKDFADWIFDKKLLAFLVENINFKRIVFTVLERVAPAKNLSGQFDDESQLFYVLI